MEKFKAYIKSDDFLKKWGYFKALFKVYLIGISRAFDIKGRSSKEEFWIFISFYVFMKVMIFSYLSLILKILESFDFLAKIFSLTASNLIVVFLLCLIPITIFSFVSIMIRRLHDLNYLRKMGVF
ncbi:MAG: hypothetical protein BWY78_00921 [Alphaproteobacteria bacterium ADurb.Bin438]|nr:MAG: hypothetical protein BWY78_00921 [Alphaproteobacteria bacterium ADurb.Bin438]